MNFECEFSRSMIVVVEALTLDLIITSRVPSILAIDCIIIDKWLKGLCAFLTQNTLHCESTLKIMIVEMIVKIIFVSLSRKLFCDLF